MLAVNKDIQTHHRETNLKYYRSCAELALTNQRLRAENANLINRVAHLEGELQEERKSWLTPAFGTSRTMQIARMKERSDVDWEGFLDWLKAQYSHSHTLIIYKWGKEHYEASIDPSRAAQLRTMSEDKRRIVMESLSAISKFTGNYETWQTVRKQAGLKWASRNPIRFIQSLLSQESNGALDWLLQSAPKLSIEHRVPLVFAALTGVRA